MQKQFFSLASAALITLAACQQADTQNTTAQVAPQPTFTVTKETVKQAFMQYLPTIADGRQLNEYWETPDGKGFKIALGDVNGDKLIDGVVDYSLQPTAEDNGGGGNAIMEFAGLIVFINTGSALQAATHDDELSINSELQIIENDGVIKLETLDFAPDDAHCCPSLKSSLKLKFQANKLVKL